RPRGIAHDARGDGVGQAERCPDGDDGLAHDQVAGLGKRGRGEVGQSVDLDDGEVVRLVRADDLGSCLPAVTGAVAVVVLTLEATVVLLLLSSTRATVPAPTPAPTRAAVTAATKMVRI